MVKTDTYSYDDSENSWVPETGMNQEYVEWFKKDQEKVDYLLFHTLFRNMSFRLMWNNNEL